MDSIITIFPIPIYLSVGFYSLLVIAQFITQHYNGTNYSYNIPYQSITSLIYSIISVTLIILFIEQLPSFDIVAKNISDKLFLDQNPTEIELEKAATASMWMVKLPVIALLCGFLGNYARAFYTLNELDNAKFNFIDFGGHFKNIGHKRWEAIIRVFILILFLSIGYLINGNIDKHNFRVSIIVFSDTKIIDFFEFFVWMGVFSFLMYSLLHIWLSINKSHFVNYRKLKELKKKQELLGDDKKEHDKEIKRRYNFRLLRIFYWTGLLLSSWFLIIGFNLIEQIPNEHFKNAAYYIMTFVAFASGGYLLYFVSRDIIVTKIEAIKEEKVLDRLKTIF